MTGAEFQDRVLGATAPEPDGQKALLAHLLGAQGDLGGVMVAVERAAGGGDLDFAEVEACIGDLVAHAAQLAGHFMVNLDAAMAGAAERAERIDPPVEPHQDTGQVEMPRCHIAWCGGVGTITKHGLFACRMHVWTLDVASHVRT